MKKLFPLLLLLVSLAFFSAAPAQTTPQTGSLADVRFIAGHWQATANGQQLEAFWSEPAGDNIAGFIRMMKDGKVTLYELFAFEQTETGPVAMVKHFRPGMIGIEEKDRPDRYNFVQTGKDRAIFQKQGEELRVLYEKRGPNQFVIALGRPENGSWTFKDLFVFNRVK